MIPIKYQNKVNLTVKFCLFDLSQQLEMGVVILVKMNTLTKNCFSQPVLLMVEY